MMNEQNIGEGPKKRVGCQPARHPASQPAPRATLRHDAVGQRGGKTGRLTDRQVGIMQEKHEKHEHEEEEGSRRNAET